MRISYINMYPDPDGDLLLQGDIVLDHVLILKNVKLIEGQYRWRMAAPFTQSPNHFTIIYFNN